MSPFIGSLCFDDLGLRSAVRLGVLIGSAVSAVAGLCGSDDVQPVQIASGRGYGIGADGQLTNHHSTDHTNTISVG